MSKRSKSYRGQRVHREALKSPCGCWYCTGNSKQDRDTKTIKELQKEIDNNTIFNGEIDTTTCINCKHAPRNLNSRTCSECDDGDNWETKWEE